MLFNNSGVDNGQRISELAASVPRAPKEAHAPVSTTAEYLEKVSYYSIAAVLRQYDIGSSKQAAITAHSSYSGTTRGAGRRNLSPEQLADLKSKSTCDQCKKMGHWKSDHKKDGTLKPGAKCFDPPKDSCTDGLSRSVTFNMCNVNNPEMV